MPFKYAPSDELNAVLVEGNADLFRVRKVDFARCDPKPFCDSSPINKMAAELIQRGTLLLYQGGELILFRRVGLDADDLVCGRDSQEIVPTILLFTSFEKRSVQIEAVGESASYRFVEIIEMGLCDAA